MRINFQTKVLLPVMTIMAGLIVGSLWLVSRRVSDQLESSAAQQLLTAEAVFHSLQSLQARNLLLRYRNVPNEPRYRAVLKLSDPKTTGGLLKDLLEEFGGDVVRFADDTEHSVAQFSRDPKFDVSEFARRTEPLVSRAGRDPDGAEVGTVIVGGRLFNVACVAVPVNREVVGTLTFGVEVNDALLKEFRGITQSDILLLVNEHVTASTLPADVMRDPGVQDLLARSKSHGHATPSMRSAPQVIEINNVHYTFRDLAEPGGGPALRYILLSSYEAPLQELRAMQRNFFWIHLFGLLIGGVMIWFLVRRVTRPLCELRDSVEAVGQGDFSRRVEIRARDEIGELADVFNGMTANLQNSRMELEKTMESLKSTQAQLVQSEKLRAIGTLAGGIAHDFNNILTAILGFSELALEEAPPETRVGRSLQQVIKAGKRAKDLVRQILAFSRRNEPERTTVRLRTIMDEVLKLLRASLPSTIEIRSGCGTDHDYVIADSTRIHQVLMNLGTNAQHAMRASGGSLEIRIDEIEVPRAGWPEAPGLEAGFYVRLSVSDTGHGMTQEVQERIFEPFFTTKPVGEGTGLGLSVVHGIIKSHGGDITVRSKAGTGTTFHIYLPQAREQKQESRISEAPVRGQSERILVVDDEEALATLLQQRLMRLGYEVVAHCDSQEALRLFQSDPTRFDVVITDQTMPRLTGEDLAERIRAVRPQTPVILCSGSGGTGTVKHGTAAVRHRVAKPINFTELSRHLRDVLQRI